MDLQSYRGIIVWRHIDVKVAIEVQIHRGTWAYDYRSREIWSYRGMEEQWYGGIQMQKHISINAQRHRDVEVWMYGRVVSWRQIDIEVEIQRPKSVELQRYGVIDLQRNNGMEAYRCRGRDKGIETQRHRSIDVWRYRGMQVWTQELRGIDIQRCIDIAHILYLRRIGLQFRYILPSFLQKEQICGLQMGHCNLLQVSLLNEMCSMSHHTSSFTYVNLTERKVTQLVCLHRCQLYEYRTRVENTTLTY